MLTALTRATSTPRWDADAVPRLRMSMRSPKGNTTAVATTAMPRAQPAVAQVEPPAQQRSNAHRPAALGHLVVPLQHKSHRPPDLLLADQNRLIEQRLAQGEGVMVDRPQAAHQRVGQLRQGGAQASDLGTVQGTRACRSSLAGNDERPPIPAGDGPTERQPGYRLC